MSNTTISNVVYPVANAGASTNAFVDFFATRNPTVNDTNYPVQKKWLNTVTNNYFFLKGFTTSNGVTTANWIPIAGSSSTETLTGNTGGPVSPTANNINVLGDTTTVTVAGNPGTSTLTISAAGGLATTYTEDTGSAQPAAGILKIVGGTAINTAGSGNTVTINAAATVATTYVCNTGSATPASNSLNVLGSGDITTTGSGSTITISVSTLAPAYTNVTHAMSPYTVLVTDYYLSVDCSGGTVTLNFPNLPTAKQTWVVKDRTGNASTNNITITTLGGTVTFDGATSYVINSNYEAINLLANATPTYEVY